VILNAYAVLDAFVSLLRFGLAVFVFWSALFVWKSWHRVARSPENKKTLEDRCYLLFLLGGSLLALNILAWPIFYLLLQSYVSEWPGVMCIYGVTRIGSGSLGSSRFLPPLLATLQTAKPLLVFLSGAWFVLYLIDRRTRTAPLTGRILLLLLAASLLAGADAAAEVAYLVIPKKEEFLSSGCCMALFDTESGTSRFVPKNLLGAGAGTWLYAAYFTTNAVMILALGAYTRWGGRRSSIGWLTPLFVGGLLSLVVNAVFLIEVAAPRLLHMPDHHCPYDLIPQAPRSLAAIAFYLGGSLFVGWGCVAGWLGNTPESRPFVAGMIGTLFRLGALGYVFSVLVLSVELALT
jgi:hypothetical protein